MSDALARVNSACDVHISFSNGDVAHRRRGIPQPCYLAANVMPPPSAKTFIYFAYGSNMLSRRLRAPGRAPSARAVGIGYVPGRRLTFDKISFDGSGKCDIATTSSATDRVWGVLFEIDSFERPGLDAAEGLGKGYKEEFVDVVTAQGVRRVLTYVATKKDDTQRPYHWYAALVISGAVEHSLPPPYIEWLRTTESKPDGDVKRRAENEELLFRG
jgi:gamma-glutamylcyclotransferase